MPLTLIDRLERRFGRFAIPNLTTFLVVGQAVLYAASRLPQGVALDRVVLDPVRVSQGEVWRLVTFLFYPPSDDTFFVIFYFMLFLFIGTTLERQWGAFRFNLYIFIGWLANLAAAFIGAAVVGQMIPDLAEGPLKLAGALAGNVFLYSSLFLAFARLYPDFVIRVMFVLPVKIKWLALLQWLTYGFLLVTGGWMTKMLILATVLNYLLFFGREHIRDLRQHRRKRTFRSQATKAVRAPTHQCRVCGANSGDSPRMAFRYCSKCEGQACYCPEHIGNHEHVTAEEPAAP
jgi:hypothetical protein